MPGSSSAAHRLEIDLTATLVEDNVYEYTTIQAGQPFVVEDSTGRVVARDRGVLRFRVLFDTGGDATQETFVDFLGVDVGGPHPGPDTTCRTPATSSG